jgi:transcriptional regulator with XRE-family HTH domain
MKTRERWHPRTRETRGGPRQGLYVGTSRTELAEFLGLSRPTISRILNGSRGCDVSRACALAKVLSIPLDDLAQDLQGIREVRRRRVDASLKRA